MRVFGTGLFLLWIFNIHVGSCNYAEVLRGQCYAFCLTRHESRQKETNEDAKPLPTDQAVILCRRDRQCRWCLYACERPEEEYHKYDGCLEDCQNKRIKHNEGARLACNDSCGFISRTLQHKFGSCPAPSDMEDFSTACVRECEEDLRCDGMYKCCDNGCGKICHRPLEHDVFPPMPDEMKFKERKDGGLLIEWGEGEPGAYIKPLLYVLRWWCPYTQGAHYSITTKTRIKLKGNPDGIQPGAKCHFMIAAVNIHGSEGFTAPETYKKHFLSPSPPLSLEKTRTKLHDGKVDVTIRWQPPLYTDSLPITKYLVFWSDSLPKASPKYVRLHMHKKALDKDRRSYTIQNLQPGMIFVQVRAVVKWKGKFIRGKPVSNYIEAYSAPQPAGSGPESPPDGSESRSGIYNITVHEPVFLISHLTANVTWSLNPDIYIKKYILSWTLSSCEGEAKHRKTRNRLEQEATTHKKYFVLYNLRSDCVYELKIQTVNFYGEVEEGGTKILRTPPCSETKGRNLKRCPPKVTPPLAPSELTVHLEQTSYCSCQAVVTWHRPVNSTVNQFAIFWGQSRPPPVGDIGVGSSTIVYNSDPYKIQVSGNDTRACMTYLERSTHYTVQIFAQASKMKSPPAIRHFTTPSNMAPCYGNDHYLPAETHTDFAGIVEKPGDELTTLSAVKYNSNSLPHQTSLLLLFVSCGLSLCFCVVLKW